MNSHRISSSVEFNTIKKGRNNERRFRYLLSDPLKTLPWISKVVRACVEDDRKKGIDFYVYTVTGWNIPVQVKSSVRGMREYQGRHQDADYPCLIVMDLRLNDDEMREKIIFFLNKWKENAIRRGKKPEL